MSKERKQNIVGWCCIFALFLVSGGVFASALATPPQQVLNWEWNSNGSSLGQVSLTTTNITVTQTGNANNPGTFPTQSVIISNDGNANGSTSDIFVTLTDDVTANATSTSNGNGVQSRHIYAGDPPLSVDGRFKFISVVRGTAGTNTNQNARITCIY
jgi:hypothetical protein